MIELTPTHAESARRGAERIVQLGECYGDLCAEHRQGAAAGVDAALDRLILEAVGWRQDRAER